MFKRKNIARATLFGVAFGDSLGKPLEFVMDRKKILRSGLGYELPLPLGVVTDDTEMTLAVARALGFAVDHDGVYNFEHLEFNLRTEYIRWQDENVWGRAAGGTCMRAVSALRRDTGRPWQLCTEPLKKGCGANMRVAPIGLIATWSEEDVADVAQLSSALTHGHPTALAAAELTALAVWALRTRVCTLDTLVDYLLERCDEQRLNYREHILGNLSNYWRANNKRYRNNALPATSERAMLVGWRENVKRLVSVKNALKYRHSGCDVAEIGGAGWVAEQALATAVYAAVRWSEHPRIALAQAVRSVGDSDSLGAIAGSLLGAAHGDDAFPDHWYDRIEYAQELEYFGRLFDNSRVASSALV